MSAKTGKLFSYFNETLRLIVEGYINEQVGKSILKSLEYEFPDKKEVYPYIGSIGGDQSDYWYEFLFKTNDDVISYLKDAAKNDWLNKNLMIKVIDRFLDMPNDVKKDFYQTNLVENKTDSRSSVPYVAMCGKAFYKANPNNIFHNIPTIFLLGCGFNTEHEKFEKICEDVQKTLNISHDKFLDIYGPSLLFCLDNKYVHNNWYNLQIDKRTELQQVIATKFYNGSRFKRDNFLEFVEKGLLPYDVKLPVGDIYLMNAVISNKINEISSYLAATPFHEDEFSKKVKEAKEFLTNLNNKYDLYFLPPKMIDYKNQIITQNFNNHHKHKQKSSLVQIESDMLDFTLSIKNIFSEKESIINKVVKKLKI